LGIVNYTIQDFYPARKEVAEVIVFLASEESSGVNGEAITVALGGIE